MNRTSPNPIDKHIGTRIRMRRLQLGMSQEALAGDLDLSFQQVQKYEKGKNRVGGSRLARIAELLGVDVGFFFQGAPGTDTGHPAVRIESTMDEFISSKDGLIIAEAFVQIADPNVRHVIASAISQISRAMAPKPIILMAAE
jgi:transcriptional regulator with XRE-family HTH domain